MKRPAHRSAAFVHALGIWFLLAGSLTSWSAVISGETVTASSEDTGWSRFAVNAVNDSGLSGTPGSQVHDTDNLNAWQTAAGDTVRTLTITFPDLYNVASFHAWNLNSETYRGAKDVNIVTFDGADGAGTSTVRGDFVFAAASGLPSYAGQEFTLGASWLDVRSVRLTMLTIQDPGQGHVGLSEIQFSGTLVPEPGIATLTVLGAFATLGLGRSRRSR